MQAVLYRYVRTNLHVLGKLYIEGEVFHTIERAWKNNESNVSCIPNGKYLCSFLPRSGSGKYRNVYHVKNVKDRFGILIHNGNLVTHTKGCIIIGSKKGILGDKQAVLGSKTALIKLNKIVTKDFELIIC